MRKLAIVGALAAALAWTNARAEDASKVKAEAREDVQKAKAEGNQQVSEAKKDAAETKQEADQKVSEARQDARQETAEARKDANEKAAEAQGTGSSSSDPYRSGQASSEGREKKHPMFEGKDNFSIDGKIQQASSSSITVAREELPAAKLTVDRNTKIELDGQQVSAAQLKPGQEVKASFNLQNDKPMAIEITAKKAEAEKQGQGSR
jgi:hypothetical protein